LRDAVEEAGYPTHLYIGHIRTRKDTFHYFDDKRRNNGEWLWHATALILSKLTGSEITVSHLREMAESPMLSIKDSPARTCQ
jgi:hypothetical protein